LTHSFPHSTQKTKLDTLARWGIPLALFLLALAVRLPGLGNFFTADEFLWVDRSREFLGGLLSADFTCRNTLTSQTVSGLACTVRTGHPGVITMWTGSLGIVMRWLSVGGGQSLLDYVRTMPVNPVEQGIIAPVRLPTVVITSLFVAVFYGLLSRLLNRRAALLAGLLLALDPFYIALSRVLHHDALSTTFMTLSALTMFVYFGQEAGRRWLLLSGGLAGLGFLSKSPELYMVPFVLLIGGWRALSVWARGQAWAIYGYTMTYRFTKDARFLETAQRAADYFIGHLPSDDVPYWDFMAPEIPNEPRDVSAAAITSSALFELSKYVKEKPQQAKYRNAATTILTSICSAPYLAEGTNSHAILNHAVGNKPTKSEVDVSIIYADYYFIEAMLRYLQQKK
jgi:hypothetical protein